MNDEGYNKQLKSISRTLGYHCSSFYGVLYDIYQYAKRREQLSAGGWFYATVQTVEDELQMNRYKQKSVVDELVKAGYLITENRGVPKKRFFKLLKTPSELKHTQETNVIYAENQRYISRIPTYENAEIQRSMSRNPTYHTQKTNDKQEQINNNKIIITNNNLREVVETYQQAFGVVNSLLFEDMKDTAERFGEEWTLQALKIAIANNVRSWKYTTAILTRWSECHGAGSKPWEEEKNGKQNKQAKRIMHGNGTAEDWEREPDEIII